MIYEVFWDYLYEDWSPYSVISNTALDLYYMVAAISDQRLDIIIV
jgi:hypothetical protein